MNDPPAQHRKGVKQRSPDEWKVRARPVLIRSPSPIRRPSAKDLEPDAPAPHRPPPSPQDRLRADVIERVRASRTAILSRARGGTAGESPALLRDGVRLELADILADEVTRAERHSCHRPDATPERHPNPNPKPWDASPAPSTSDDGMWNDDPIVKPRSRRSPSPPQPSSPATSWDEHAGTKLTSVEYEDLMLAMHEAVEEDLRREEAAMLAAELESVEAQEADELAAAVASFEAWTVDSSSSGRGGDSTPAVPCPVCSTRRVLMTDDVLFCGCGNFRLARGEVPGERRVRARAGRHRGDARGSLGSSANDGFIDEREASFGLEHLRRRLADTYAAHAEIGGCDDGRALAFDVRDAFGVEALWAECGRCGFIETVM